MQDHLGELLLSAGGDDPIQALIRVSPNRERSPLLGLDDAVPGVKLEPAFHLEGGKPRMLLQCPDLPSFMRMEIALVALEGAKLATCAHCPNLFITGATTTRRSHAIYCSDRCRVAAMRKRKMGGMHNEHS
jgi:hypothetical protein